jgi:hypothetical protein
MGQEHKEFARAFESFPKDADKLYPGWREKLGAPHRGGGPAERFAAVGTAPPPG